MLRCDRVHTASKQRRTRSKPSPSRSTSHASPLSVLFHPTHFQLVDFCLQAPLRLFALLEYLILSTAIHIMSTGVVMTAESAALQSHATAAASAVAAQCPPALDTADHPAVGLAVRPRL